MNLLAIESADGSCSLAWLRDGVASVVMHNTVIKDSLSWMGNEVARLQAEQGLRWSDLDGIACCVGPGGFTGVRVAVGYCQGLAIATGLPVCAVSSMESLMWRLAEKLPQEQCDAQVSLDARMGELYVAQYRRMPGTQWKMVGSEQVIAPADLLEQQDGAGTPAMARGGPGFSAYADLVWGNRLYADINLDAEAVGLAACAATPERWVNAEQLTPTYLRNKVADTLAERAANAALKQASSD